MTNNGKNNIPQPQKNWTFGWRDWILVLGLLLSLAVIVIFGIRALRHVPRSLVDEPMRPWMSVPYIAHSYHVPPHVLLTALGLPSKPPDKRPILVIARAQKRTVQTVEADLQNAIIQARLSSPSPQPLSPQPTRGTP
jgi:hypothetical protein